MSNNQKISSNQNLEKRISALETKIASLGGGVNPELEIKGQILAGTSSLEESDLLFHIEFDNGYVYDNYIAYELPTNIIGVQSCNYIIPFNLISYNYYDRCINSKITTIKIRSNSHRKRIIQNLIPATHWAQVIFGKIDDKTANISAAERSWDATDYAINYKLNSPNLVVPSSACITFNEWFLLPKSILNDYYSV